MLDICVDVRSFCRKSITPLLVFLYPSSTMFLSFLLFFLHVLLFVYYFLLTLAVCIFFALLPPKRWGSKITRNIGQLLPKLALAKKAVNTPNRIKIVALESRFSPQEWRGLENPIKLVDSGKHTAEAKRPKPQLQKCTRKNPFFHDPQKWRWANKKKQKCKIPYALRRRTPKPPNWEKKNAQKVTQ